MYTFAQTIDVKTLAAVLTAVAVAVAFVVKVWLENRRAKDAPVAVLTAKHAEAILQTAEHAAAIRSILEREHPITQTLRVYTPLQLEESIAKLQAAVEELGDRSGVWTDPGRPPQ